MVFSDVTDGLSLPQWTIDETAHAARQRLALRAGVARTLADNDGLGLPDGAFAKLDAEEDEFFYEPPRLVPHIDDGAIAALTGFYRKVLPAGGILLDLMSSWVSHLPPEIEYAEVIGHGMNADRARRQPAAQPLVCPEPQPRHDAAACRRQRRRRDDLRLDPVSAAAGRRAARGRAGAAARARRSSSAFRTAASGPKRSRSGARSTMKATPDLSSITCDRAGFERIEIHRLAKVGGGCQRPDDCRHRLRPDDVTNNEREDSDGGIARGEIGADHRRRRAGSAALRRSPSRARERASRWPTSRSSRPRDRGADQCGRRPGDCAFRRGDEDDEVRAMVEDVVRTYGGLDCAFNNAGIAGFQVDAAGKKTADWSEEVLRPHDRGQSEERMAVHADELKQMQAQGGGAIVNTGSIAGLAGLPTSSAYVAAKHGVVGLTKTAAHRIRRRPTSGSTRSAPALSRRG